MLFLLFAMIASTSILICFKVFNKVHVNTITAIAFNYLTGAILGFFLVSQNVTGQEVLHAPWLFLASMMGFILIAGFILFARSTKLAGIAITSISSRVSVVFSVMLGIFLFNDTMSLLKISGFLLAIIGLILIFYSKDKVKVDTSSIVIPLLVFLLSGLNDSTLKVAQYYFIQDNEIDYISFAATSFLSAFLLCLPLLAYNYYQKHKNFHVRDIAAGIFLGLLNWFSIYFMLKGLNIMEVSVFFPILNMGVVTLSTVVGYVIFKEKLKFINLLGIGIAIISIILITLKF
jgi:drug/metabolite transporter (DMT)-like permease